MIKMTKTNTPREKEQVAVDFLDSLLIIQEINIEHFYRLLKGLEMVHYLADINPRLTNSSVLKIEAKYNGDKEIGRARDTTQVGSQVKPQIQRQVEELYADLSDRTGYKFHQPSPSLQEHYCHATVLFGENINLNSVRSKGKLEVILYK